MDAFWRMPGPGGGRVLLDRGHVHRPGPRDPWLRWFGQGQWADKAPGSGWLALQAHAVSRPEVLRKATSDEVLGIGRAWKALEGWTFARKLTVVRELIRRHPKDERYDPDDARGLPGEWEPALHQEIAAALGISVIAAGKLARLAWTLDTRLRGIAQALEDNRLDPARVKLIADETSVLADEALFPQAEAIILAGLPGCKTWGALLRLVQRAVITVDPDGAKRRREQAEREHARLRFWRENCGTCAMQATGLPTDEALAANANIEARARAYKNARVGRPMDILRVMAYLDLLNGVTIAQRAAWVRADDTARQAEEAEKAARDRVRRDAAADRAGRDPGAGGRDGPAGDGPRSPDDGTPDGGGPQDDGPASPDDSGPDGGSPGGPSNGTPDGDGLRDDGPAGPDDSGPDDSGPDGDGPDGDGPDGDGPDDSGSDGDGPDDSGSDDSGPDGDGPGGPSDGTSPQGGDGGYPGDWPVDDGGYGGAGSGYCRPSGGPTARDPGGDRGDRDPAGPPCQQCGGAGGGTGLPVRASLTIPASALEWLAEWSARNTASAARGLTGTGAGAGGGGPGIRHRGGPGPCPACGSQGSASMPVREHLVLPLLTLAGLADRPGEAHGLGALDPALVRDLAAAGARHPASQLCLTVTDEDGFAVGHGCCRSMRGAKGRAIPVDPQRAIITPSGRAGPDGGLGSWILTLPGAPLPFIVDIHPVPTYECDHRFESAGYQPSGRLRHLVQVRDGECSFPACSRHARESDYEHAVPYGKGGRTCGCNAHACSRSCHRAKQSRGWRVTKPRPGWTQWTTGAGRTYIQEPWRYPR